MGAGSSVQNRPPLSPRAIFNLCAQRILEIIAPEKNIGTRVEEEPDGEFTDREAGITFVILNIDGSQYLALGGDEGKSLRKKLSSKERQLFIDALAFVTAEIGGNSSMSIARRYLGNYNSSAVSDEVRIPVEFIERQFYETEDRLGEALEKFEKIQNYAFYSNATTIDPNAEINATEEEINAGVKAYFDEQALEDLKTDIEIGNPLAVDEDLAWLEKRGFDLPAVEERFSLAPYAVEHEASHAVIKHLIENLECDLGNRADLFLAAVKHSNIETVKYLHDNYPAENQHSLSALGVAIDAYLSRVDAVAAEKDKVAAFLISEGFAFDERSRRLLGGNGEESDLALVAACGMIETTKELAKKSSFIDLIELLPRLEDTGVIDDVFNEIRVEENKIIKERGIDPEEPEMGDEFACPISYELMKHPVKICDAQGVELYPHTFDEKNIRDSLGVKLENPLGRGTVPADYTLVTDAETLKKVMNHYVTKYMPAIEKLIAANCPLKAYELLNSIDEKTIQNFKELPVAANEEECKLEDIEDKSFEELLETEEPKEIKDLRKWREEKKQEIFKLARNKPIELSSAETLAKQGRENTLT